MSRLLRWTAVLSCSAALALVGCGDDDDDGPGDGNEVACPPAGTALTEQNFGRPFLDAYCTRCHASTRTGAARNGAPPGLDWDQLAVVRANAARINEAAGAQADGSVNQEMPPNDPRPMDAERRNLAEWLACGAP
ncbi:c-type cytochrome [Pyxidicoccus xibeiensis]|uniref:c-type cytochrome n=1 Tax=Pyxidicoccus xibeiensis TaxID=2906759 RepID=UPI0020A6ED96|nr:c-type cytochrome [Pyxidicoccus xibeiensis]MCP3137146.1 c-type cytochrome [Pyxidicoccus xibeiensis]